MSCPRPAFFALLSLAAVLSINVNAAHGPEIVVGGSISALAPGLRFAPATATNGADDFVVWLDERSGTPAIVGTRIRNGAVLDPLGIVVDRGPAGVPHVVAIGDSWLVIWNGAIDNGSGGNVSQVMAARVSRDGEIVTPPKVVLEAAIATDLAVIGSRAVAVVWRDDAIHALVLDADANVIADHRLATRFVTEHDSVIAAGATQFAILWRDRSGTLEAVRLSSRGDVLDATPRTIGLGERPDLASDRIGFALVAFDPQTETWFTRRIAPDLTAGPVHPLPDSANLGPMSVVWTGSRYVAMALDHQQQQLYAGFLDEDGASPPARIIPWPGLSSYGGDISVVARRGQLAVTSVRDVRGLDRHVVQTEFLNAATLEKQGPAQALSWSGNEHSAPQVAFDGTNTLVVWRERDGIFATRVTPDGQSLDGRGIELAGPSVGWYLRNPEVVFDGTQYIVAWPDPNAEPARIFIRFIDPASGIASEPLSIPGGAPAVSLAVGKDATLITWSANRPMAARIDRASRSMSAPVMLATHITSSVRAAWNGTHFLVAWNEIVVGPRLSSPSLRIRGTRVTESLAILDANPLLLGDSPPYVEHSPVLASNGDEWLIVWTLETFPAQLRARRIAADGTGIGSEEGTRLNLQRSQNVAPALIWDGSRYALASDIGLLWLMPDLGFAGSSKIAATASSVSLARTTSGTTAAYTRPIWDAPYAGVNRSVLRHLARPVRRRAVR